VLFRSLGLSLLVGIGLKLPVGVMLPVALGLSLLVGIGLKLPVGVMLPVALGLSLLVGIGLKLSVGVKALAHEFLRSIIGLLPHPKCFVIHFVTEDRHRAFICRVGSRSVCVS
jgi:hypothetical protein